MAGLVEDCNLEDKLLRADGSGESLDVEGCPPREYDVEALDMMIRLVEYLVGKNAF